MKVSTGKKLELNLITNIFRLYNFIFVWYVCNYISSQTSSENSRKTALKASLAYFHPFAETAFVYTLTLFLALLLQLLSNTGFRKWGAFLQLSYMSKRSWPSINV